jgi:hypothetical protein
VFLSGKVSRTSARWLVWMILAIFFGACCLSAIVLRAGTVTVTSGPVPFTRDSGPYTLVPATAGPARQRQVDDMIAGLRVMNYYPAADAWNKMWTNWKPGILRHDFAQIHALGANTVRVVVFPSTFGWPTVSPIIAHRLADMLAIAASTGLGVQLTLFDRWGSYSEIAESKVWLLSLLRPYAADPEIRLIELKNEVDPSDAPEISWLRALLASLRSVMPGTPVTASVSGPDGPSEFERLRSELSGAPLDVADIHFYGSERSAYSWMLEAKRAAGPLPLFIGEVGYPVQAGVTGIEAAEMNQAHWYDVVFTAARAAGLSVPAPWTWNDFDPGAIPGPAEPAEQYDFGLHAVTGQARPAAQVVENAYNGLSSNTSNLDFTLAGTNGLPMVWSTYLPAQGILAYDPKVGYRQPGSVRISNTILTSLGAPAFYEVPVEPAIPGELWTVEAWAKGIDVNGTAQVALAWFNSSGSFLGDSGSEPLPHGDPDWTDLRLQARVPAGASGVQINLKSYNVTGTVWFDDVRITVSP